MWFMHLTMPADVVVIDERHSRVSSAVYLSRTHGQSNDGMTTTSQRIPDTRMPTSDGDGRWLADDGSDDLDQSEIFS